MAKRPSVKEILEAARKGGPAKPKEEEAQEAQTALEPEPVSEAVEEAVVEAAPARHAAPPAPPANVPNPSTLGRPLTLKEKLAAARAGGAASPATAAPAAKAPATESPATEPADVAEAAVEEPAPAAKLVPKPAPPIGRPLTLAEKLAAARAGAGAAPASASAAAKPAAAKPAAVPAAKGTAARALPPLEKITDPRDLAEALRQTGAKKAKEIAAKAIPAESPAKAPTKPAPAKPSTVLPKPTKTAATAATAAPAGSDRRGFVIGSLFMSWIALAWTSFTAGVTAFTVMMGRFMFPNVLAEPPSSVKVGLPSNYDPEDVNERFKAEWGFWIVRSTRYDGQDIIYALQSVCTHLGCPPNWLAAEQKFKCPCHGSGFYISGINFEGPAPRPLERFKVSMADDGQILVDKSKTFKQESGQWSDTESFLMA
jgi:cytochrome b6-f complex iron-sulfur subunit